MKALAAIGGGSESVEETDPIVGAVNGLVKADGAGYISAASAETDYQEPLTAGTDYQTPLAADTDYLTPGTAASTYQLQGSYLESESDPIVGAITGLVMADGGGNIVAATADVDYLLNETDPVVGAVTGLVLADGAGNISAATAGTDYEGALGNPASDNYLLSSLADGTRSWVPPIGETETDPVVGAITGIVLADGAGSISAAVAGTDYLAPDAATATPTGDKIPIADSSGKLDADWLPVGSGTNIREQLTADITRYVRTDGDDGNDGTANDAGHAWLTIQHAVDVCSRYDLGGYDITIQVGDGTYTENVTLKTFVGDGVITIQGNTGDMTAVIIAASDATYPAIWADTIRGRYELGYLKFTGNGIRADGFGTLLTFGNCNFGDCTGRTHISAFTGGVIRNNLISGTYRDYTISGPGYAHFYAGKDGQIYVQYCTVTVSGTPAFSQAFAYIIQTGFLQVFSLVFSGGATGKRHVIDTAGQTAGTSGGATFFPGDTGGTVDAAEFALYN